MILLLSFFACAPEAGCTMIAAYSTTISVVDDAGAPIAGATATYTVDGGSPKPCDSWSAGQLACGIEEAGHFVVEVSADGFIGSSAEVEVEADECHVIGEVLEIGLETLACTAEVVPSATVSVQAEEQISGG